MLSRVHVIKNNVGHVADPSLPPAAATNEVLFSAPKHTPDIWKMLSVSQVVRFAELPPFNPLTSRFSVFSPACLPVRAGCCVADLALLCLQPFPSNTIVNVHCRRAATSLLWRRRRAVLRLPSSSTSLTLLQSLLQTLICFASSVISVNKRRAPMLGVSICRDWGTKKKQNLWMHNNIDSHRIKDLSGSQRRLKMVKSKVTVRDINKQCSSEANWPRLKNWKTKQFDSVHDCVATQWE